MANDNHIKNFTPTDIEKYHNGLLSPKERHALEKAALDDPFLADALEGYAVEGINVNADIAELKKRLAEKTEQAKVIPIQPQAGLSFPWLRAAVMVILIAGAGVLASIEISRSTTSYVRALIENPNGNNPFQLEGKTGKQKASFTTVRGALFADVQLGRVRTGPAAGIRFLQYINPSYQNIMLYAIWKL